MSSNRGSYRMLFIYCGFTEFKLDIVSSILSEWLARNTARRLAAEGPVQKLPPAPPSPVCAPHPVRCPPQRRRAPTEIGRLTGLEWLCAKSLS